MADAKTAIDFVLHQEDATLSGKATTDAGGRTRFGIAEKFHPDLTVMDFYDGMTADQALAVAENIYRTTYWAAISGDAVAAQDLANRVLSFAVNLGPRQAVSLLQQAAGALGAALEDDGAMGPGTLAAVNSMDTEKLLATWRELLEGYYRRIVANRPTQAIYLNGWLHRVAA